MSSHFKSFLGYGLAALLQGVVAFVTVPLLIKILGVRLFAIWAIFEPVVASLAQLALLGSCYGFIRMLAMKLRSSGDLYKAQFKYGALPLVFVAVVGGCSLVNYLNFPDKFMAVILGSVFIACEAILLLVQSVLRGESKSTSYAAVVWVRYGLLGGVVFGLAYFDIKILTNQYMALLISIDVFALLTALYSFVSSPSTGEVEVSDSSGLRGLYFGSVKYGIPIVIASVLAMIVSNGDRYVVHAMLSTDQLAGYVTIAKLAGAMAFASAPVNLWWPSARFKHASDRDQGAMFYSSAATLLLAYYGVVAMLAYLLAPVAIHWYGNGVMGYDSSSMALLLAAAMATAMVTPMNVGTLNEGKTHWSIYAVGISAIVGLMAAFLLIPLFGYVGAALSTLMAQTINLVLTHWVSQKIQPLSFEYKKPIFILVLFSVIMFILSKFAWSTMITWGGFAIFVCAVAYLTADEVIRVLKV